LPKDLINRSVRTFNLDIFSFIEMFKKKKIPIDRQTAVWTSNKSTARGIRPVNRKITLAKLRDWVLRRQWQRTKYIEYEHMTYRNIYETKLNGPRPVTLTRVFVVLSSWPNRGTHRTTLNEPCNQIIIWSRADFTNTHGKLRKCRSFRHATWKILGQRFQRKTVNRFYFCKPVSESIPRRTPERGILLKKYIFT